MANGSDYEFDAFISYSHKDLDWVKGILIPKLDVFEVKYAVDYRDFRTSQSIQSEMGRLMQSSRRTLIVLTPNWLASNWTAFEMQSIRTFQGDEFHNRFLILQPGPCDVPELLRDVTTISWNALGEAAAFRKLRRSILAARVGRGALLPLNGGLTMAKKHASPNWFGVRRSNFEYQFTVDVEMRFPTEVAFDAIILRAEVPKTFQMHDEDVDTVRILLTKDGVQIGYSRTGLSGLADADSSDVLIEPALLKGPKGIRNHDLPLQGLVSSISGKCILQLSVALYYADVPVTNEISCALPPLSRLPEAYVSKGLEVPCVPKYCLPASSGIVELSTVQRLLDTAADFSPDSILLSVSAITMTMWSSGEYGSLQQFEGWQCEFSSDSRNCVYYIATADPSWIDQSQERQGHLKPDSWITPAMLMSCKVDATLAYLIALQSGGRCQIRKDGEGAEKYFVERRQPTNMRLEAKIVSGRWRPVWFIPLFMDERTMAVFADTGEISAAAGSELIKLRHQIWNP